MNRDMSLESYLADKRCQLAHSYEGDCVVIAQEIARFLIEAGKQPFIGCLHKEEDQDGQTFHHPLMPKKYQGRITWTKHYVCCCEGMVYDPMLEETIEIEHYSRAAFGAEFAVVRYIGEEAMAEYLRRPSQREHSTATK